MINFWQWLVGVACVMGILNLQGFPSYCFIGRNGEISSENIPRFNDPQLVEFLRSKK